MELVVLVWSLAQIVGAGVLTKVGENILDAASPKIQELFDVIERKIPQTKTAKALKSGQNLDYEQTIIDVEPIEQDPEVIQLSTEVLALIAQNQELQAKLKSAMTRIPTKNTQVIQGKSQGNQFKAPIRHVTINSIPNPD
jgi:hypothetical protein